MRLDADYQLSEALIAEIDLLDPTSDVAAYRVSFDYAIFGRPLRASLYPPNTILLRNGCFSVYDRGHTEAWRIWGRVQTLKGKIVHDDRKTAAHFVSSQVRYMQREVKDLSAPRKPLKTRFRLLPPLMPIVTFVYAYVGKALFLDGRAGLYYALQRLVAESILALMVLENMLREKTGGEDQRIASEHGKVGNGSSDTEGHQ